MAKREGGRIAQRPFGPAARKVPVVGQGTWYIDDAHRPAAVAALRRELDLGMSHIDTAEMYGDAELVVGEAVAGRRDDVFLISKVLPSNASARGTIAVCERSLTRLPADRLDCHLLHLPGSHPLAETFGTFERLCEQGKILSWGVSNFNVPDLEAAWAAGGEGRIACNQVLYNLEERAIEHAVLPWCETRSVAVVAYGPFGHGRFPDARSAGGHVLEEIAADHGSTARQVALGFLVPAAVHVRHPQGVHPRTRRRQCGRWCAGADGRRTRPDRCGVPARSPATPPSHAVGRCRVRQRSKGSRGEADYDD